jgi:hypothetical protein
MGMKMDTPEDFKGRAEVTRRDAHPAPRDWSPSRAREACKRALYKLANSMPGGWAAVGQVCEDPAGFMAEVITESLGSVSLTFRFPVHDDRPTAPEGADTGAHVSTSGSLVVPDFVMNKLAGIMGRVAPLNMPAVVPAPRKGDPSVMRYPVRVIRNGKKVSIGDCFDGAKGNRVFGRGNGSGGLPIKHRKKSAPTPKLGRDFAMGTSGAPVPNGYPKKIPQFVWKKGG